MDLTVTNLRLLDIRKRLMFRGGGFSSNPVTSGYEAGCGWDDKDKNPSLSLR
jgi:hypothetical protein